MKLMITPQATAPSAGSGIFDVYARTDETGQLFFAAGFPSYPANFSRDGFMAGIISGNPHILLAQLHMSARFQGTRNDPSTGEEPGRIHHELPGAVLPGRDGTTTYNACDTTSLFLIAAESLVHIDRLAGLEFVTHHRASLVAAAQYVAARLDKDSLFQKAPPPGAEHYTLRVTYWKDSILPTGDGAVEPIYPVIYPQAHFVAARSMLAASRLLGNKRYARLADRMYRSGIRHFLRHDGYVAFRDARGEQLQPSSDELHALAYIPSEYAGLLPLDNIKARAARLATPFGFQCTPTEVATTLSDRYHGDRVWVIDQAFIHYGAQRFGLDGEAFTAAAVAPYIDEGQELFKVYADDDGKLLPIPDGNPRQLWSVAAAEYFAGRSPLAAGQWL